MCVCRFYSILQNEIAEFLGILEGWLCKQPKHGYYVMDLILPLAALLLIGFASFGLHRKILPRYSQTAKLWVTIAGATLLAILFTFAPG